MFRECWACSVGVAAESRAGAAEMIRSACRDTSCEARAAGTRRAVMRSRTSPISRKEKIATPAPTMARALIPRKASNNRLATPNRDSIREGPAWPAMAEGSGLTRYRSARSRQWRRASPLTRLFLRIAGCGYVPRPASSAIWKRQRARIEKSALRNVSPANRGRPKLHVAVVDFTRQRILSPDFGENLAGEFAERLQNRVIELADLDRRIIGNFLESDGIVGSELGVGSVILRRRRSFNDAALGRTEAVPQLFVHGEREHRSRFVKARIVVVLRGLLQPERHVHPRTGKFAGVDCARTERRNDFAGGKSNDHCAKPAQNLAADTRHAVAQPPVGVDTGNFLGEPAAHLRTGIAAHERLEAETGAQLVPKRLATPVIDPRVDFVSGESKRHVTEKGEHRRLAGPGNFRAVIHVGQAGSGGVERLHGADEFTSCEHLDVQAAAGKCGDGLRGPLGGRLQTRQGLRPGCDHLELAHTLGDGGPWKC